MLRRWCVKRGGDVMMKSNTCNTGINNLNDISHVKRTVHFFRYYAHIKWMSHAWIIMSKKFVKKIQTCIIIIWKRANTYYGIMAKYLAARKNSIFCWEILHMPPYFMTWWLFQQQKSATGNNNNKKFCDDVFPVFAQFPCNLK